MKEYRSQCVRIALSMLIALCFTSCRMFNYIIEGSFDIGKQKYTGPSYDVSESNAGVGFNVAYLFLVSPGKKKNTTSFLQPANKFRKYQLAYATPLHTFQAFGRGKYYHQPSLSQQTSAGEFLDHFGVLSGLEFIRKNSKFEDAKIGLSYLQVPVLAIYTYDLSDDRKVFGGLGPYFAYGLGGKIKGNGFSEKAFDKDFGFKRFDAGLTFTAGYKFNKKWSVRLAYDIGLTNMERISFDKAKNRSFSVNIGYWPEFIEKLLGR